MQQRVRLGEPSDEDELLALYRERHEEVGTPGLEIDDERVRYSLRRGLCEGRGSDGTFAGYPLPAWIGVIGSSGKIEGAAYVEMLMPWDSVKTILYEKWNFVRAPFRKSPNSQDLIAFSQGMADALRVYPLILTSNTREEAKWRIYTRRVGTPVGATFLYRGAEA